MGWVFDPTSTQIVWETTHLGLVSVRGGFRRLNVTANLDGDDASQWSVEVEVDVASLDSWAEKRDAALMKPDYFNAEAYPAISFKSTRVEGSASDLRVTGELAMVGVTREVTLAARLNAETVDPRGLSRRGFSGTASIRWSDFVSNEVSRGGWDNSIFRDEIAIEVQIEFAKEPDDLG